MADATGNTARTCTIVHIYEKSGRGTTLVKVVDETGKAIPHALIYVQTANGEKLSLKADSRDYVTVAAPVGSHKVVAYATGYLPDDVEILISEYETREYTLILVEDERVIGNLSVRRMTLEEMAEAGVDFSNPENWNHFVFEIKV